MNMEPQQSDIQGLPPGAVVKPLQSSQPQVQGLPAGAIVKPIGQQQEQPQDEGISGSQTLGEDQKGVVNNIKDVGSSYLHLIPNVYHAFMDDAKDETEEGSATALSQMHNIPKALALGLHRLIVAPMIRDSEAAEAYEKLAKIHPEMRDEYMSRAKSHRLASMEPLIGNQVENFEEHWAQGDKSGAVVQLLNLLAAPKVAEGALGVAGKAIGKIAPKVAKVAGVDVPVLASKTGSKAGSAAEGIAKGVGVSGRGAMEQFASKQAQAGEQAIGGIARESASPVARQLDSASIPARSIQPVNAINALSGVESFEDASKALKEAAGEHFKDLDTATGGEFQKLTDERTQIVKNLRNPNISYADMQKLNQSLADLDIREDALFKKNNISQGSQDALGVARQAYKQASAMSEFDARLKGALSQGVEEGTAPLKTTTGDTVETRTPELIGNKILNAMNKMKPKRLLEAVGGNQAHIDAMRNLGDVLATGKNATKIGDTARWLQRFITAGGVGTSVVHPMAGAAILGGKEALSGLVGKLLTNPKAANAFANGIKVNAGTMVIANSVVKALNEGKESTQNE